MKILNIQYRLEEAPNGDVLLTIVALEVEGDGPEEEDDSDFGEFAAFVDEAFRDQRMRDR